MIWLLTRPVVWPLKTAGYSAKAGYLTGRAVGYRRILVLLIGVAIGVLVAPGPGKDLREKLWAKASGGRSMGELGPVGSTSSTPESAAAAAEVVDLTDGGDTPD